MKSPPSSGKIRKPGKKQTSRREIQVWNVVPSPNYRAL
jgi:hypothetical protein